MFTICISSKLPAILSMHLLRSLVSNIHLHLLDAVLNSGDVKSLVYVVALLPSFNCL